MQSSCANQIFSASCKLNDQFCKYSRTRQRRSYATISTTQRFANCLFRSRSAFSMHVDGSIMMLRMMIQHSAMYIYGQAEPTRNFRTPTMESHTSFTAMLWAIFRALLLIERLVTGVDASIVAKGDSHILATCEGQEDGSTVSHMRVFCNQNTRDIAFSEFKTTSAAACMRECFSTPACYHMTYYGYNTWCYLKGPASALSGPDGSIQILSIRDQCVGMNSDYPNYTLYCNQRGRGTILETHDHITFAECMTKCTNYGNECEGVSRFTLNGTCHLVGSFTDLNSDKLWDYAARLCLMPETVTVTATLDPATVTVTPDNCCYTEFL